MKRLAFFGALLASIVAWAQMVPDVLAVNLAARRRKKPANGECPACGTMAGPYIRKPGTGAPSTCAGEYPKLPGNPYCEVWPTITVRCEHCSCRFDQDSENA